MRMTFRYSLSAFLPGATLVFCLFPYTQIIPLDTYNQPYALALSFLILILNPKAIFSLPQIDQIMLSYLAFLGVMLLLLELPFGIETREMAFTISYITPVVTTAAVFCILLRNPTMVRKILIAAAVIWFGVNIIQSFIAPTFLTQLVTRDLELADNVVASGRGILGLSPEPTHNAFHNLLLGASLLMVGGPLWAVALSISSAILLAKSSSAVLAIGLGLLLWAVRHPLRRWWALLPFVIPQLVIYILTFFVNEQSRLGSIILSLKDLDPSIVLLDNSVNMRIGGATMPILYSIQDFLLPQGISIQSWLALRHDILADQSWLMDLSLNGPASGFGLFIVQGGVFSLPVIIYFINRLFLNNLPSLASLGSVVVLAVFLGQFYFATPIFGLFYATLIWRSRSKPCKSAVRT